MKEHDSPEPVEPIVDVQSEAPGGDAVPPEPEAPAFRPLHAQAVPLRARLQRIDGDAAIPDELKRDIKRELVLQEVARYGTRRAFLNRTGRKHIPER